jgi:hypothetical protein
MAALHKHIMIDIITIVNMDKRREMHTVLNPESIPVEGALGLLALGSVGLRAWRNVRDAFVRTQGTVPRTASTADLPKQDRDDRSEKGGTA